MKTSNILTLLIWVLVSVANLTIYISGHDHSVYSLGTGIFFALGAVVSAIIFSTNSIIEAIKK